MAGLPLGPRCGGQTDVFKKGADTGPLVEAPWLTLLAREEGGYCPGGNLISTGAKDWLVPHRVGGALQPRRLVEKHLFKDHLTAGEAASLKMIYFSLLCFIFLS